MKNYYFLFKESKSWLKTCPTTCGTTPPSKALKGMTWSISGILKPPYIGTYTHKVSWRQFLKGSKVRIKVRLRLLGQSRFKSCPWQRCTEKTARRRLACCQLGWGSTNIGDPSKCDLSGSVGVLKNGKYSFKLYLPDSLSNCEKVTSTDASLNRPKRLFCHSALSY